MRPRVNEIVKRSWIFLLNLYFKDSKIKLNNLDNDRHEARAPLLLDYMGNNLTKTTTNILI